MSDQTSEEQDPSSDTAQNIVCMFKKANKLGQEAILYWYYFIEKYDKRIDNLVAGGVKKKTATSMVYQEIKQLLPDITDVNFSHNETVKILHDQSHVTLKTVSHENDQIKAEITSANILSASQSNPTLKIFDNYGITDETLCPLCKLDHNDEEGIEGRYKAGSYFIKCEQRKIEIVA
ncbi:hypothetical protein RclHR1_03650017 [Rhizophagus clarus]|uniref:Uncharacterized protein n=1 Tax=Rhizophagus clarus TaxID=94130 RepID=A0A2Z6RTF8_9GLOM|nr:hypothetical protein RclHR1_03650017 [Rhizophagus clarus]